MKHLNLLIMLFLLALVSCATAPKDRQIVGFSFDADDNLFNLPTKIIVFEKGTDNEKMVSTGEFAEIRKHISAAKGKAHDGKKTIKGKTNWANYEIRYDRKTGSYKYFGDQIGDGVNHFLKDLKAAMKKDSTHWKAKSFDAFVTAMNEKVTASETTIITARGRNSETINEALGYLKTQGFFRNTPNSKNIWAVSNPNFVERFKSEFKKEVPGGSATRPAARKAAIMQELLTDISETKIPAGACLVTKPVGDKSESAMHLWGSSDDDYGNFAKAKDVIQAGLDKGQWSNVKVTLYFTGVHNPKYKPHAIVLRANKKARKMMDKEDTQWKKILIWNKYYSKEDCNQEQTQDKIVKLL